VLNEREAILDRLISTLLNEDSTVVELFIEQMISLPEQAAFTQQSN
jgi:hypothetical protein